MFKRFSFLLLIGVSLVARAIGEETKQDGLSLKTAIVVTAKDEKDGPTLEVTWVRQNYPSSKILRFVTRPSKDGKVYDVFFIKTSDGKALQLYFEISSFYHKP